MRPTITAAEFDEVTELVPAPAGFSWQKDPAGSGDRIRLFSSRGQVGLVQPGDGPCCYWAVDSTTKYGYANSGVIHSLTRTRALQYAMERVLVEAKLT